MQMFQLDGHEIQLLGQLQRQQRNLQFCDTLLQTDGISVPTHSCVLAALSPYLSERLSATAPPPFGHKRQLQIQSIRASTLLKLVGLLYSGKIEVIGSTESNDVLAAARQFGITNLKEDGVNSRMENWDQKYMRCEKYGVKTPAGSDCEGSRRKQDAQVQVGKTCDHCGTHSYVKKRHFGTQTTDVEKDNPLNCRTLNAVSSPAQNKTKTHELHLGKQSNIIHDSTSEPLPLNLSLNSSYNSLSPHSGGIQKDCVQGAEAQEQTLCTKTTIYPLQTSSEVNTGSSTLKVCPNNKVGRKNLTRMKQMETQRFSFKVKLRRKTSGGGVWEVVSLQDLDEKLSVFATETQESSDPRNQQYTPPDVRSSPSSDELSAAAQPQDCTVESEEQIEKLLEDIMMGLDILPNLESDCKKSGCLQQNHGDFTCSDSVREQDAEQIQCNQDSLSQSCTTGEKAQSQPIDPHHGTLQQSYSDGQCKCPKSPTPNITPQSQQDESKLYAPGFQELFCPKDVDCFTLPLLPKLQYLCCLSPIDPLSPESEQPPLDPAQPWFLPSSKHKDHHCVAAHSDAGHICWSADCLELPKSVQVSDSSAHASQMGAEVTFRPMRRKRSTPKEDKSAKRKRKDAPDHTSNEVVPRMGIKRRKTAVKYGGKPNQTAEMNERDSRDSEADRSKLKTDDPLVKDGSVQLSRVALPLKKGPRRTGKVRQKLRAAAAPATAAACTQEIRDKGVGGKRRVAIDDSNIITLGEREATKQIVTRNKYHKFIQSGNRADVQSENLANMDVENRKQSPELEVGGVSEEWKQASQDENQNEIIHDDEGPQQHNPKSSSPTACWLDNLLVNVSEEAVERPGPQKLPDQDLPSEKPQASLKYGNLAGGSTTAADVALNPACSTDEETVNRTSERADVFPQTEEESDVDVVFQSPDQEAFVTECVKFNLDISPTDDEEDEEVEVNVTDDDSQ